MKDWYCCPVCEQKLLKIDDNTEIKGVYIKCKKCRQEVEIINHIKPDNNLKDSA